MEAVKEVNPRFEDFLFDWDHKLYFLVGGYGSSKSYHIALKIILKLLEEKRKCLVVREVFDTLRDSCHSLFEEIIEDLGLADKVKVMKSPMAIKFPNGSEIIYKGLDKVRKLKSINGLSMAWIEECSEVKYEGFLEVLNGRLRHPTLKNHIILSTNPVSKSNWTYKHFFKTKDSDNKEVIFCDDEELYKKGTIIIDDAYYHHSKADDNLFLPEDYIKSLDSLKIHDEDLYRIARMGQFGINGERVLPQFRVKPHDEVMEAVNKIPRSMKRVGMDFGFVTSFNSVLRTAIDHDRKILYIYWEYYSKGKTDVEIAKDIIEFKESRERIIADCAESKSIAYYRQMGFNMIPCKKFQGSRLQNTKKIKRFYQIICSDQCKTAIEELQDLTYKKDNDGNIVEDEFNIDSHHMSSLWYALDGYEVSDLKGNALRSLNKNTLNI